MVGLIKAWGCRKASCLKGSCCRQTNKPRFLEARTIRVGGKPFVETFVFKVALQRLDGSRG